MAFCPDQIIQKTHLESIYALFIFSVFVVFLYFGDIIDCRGGTIDCRGGNKSQFKEEVNVCKAVLRNIEGDIRGDKISTTWSERNN